MIYGNNLTKFLEKMDKESNSFQTAMTSLEKNIEGLQNLINSIPEALIAVIERSQKVASQIQKQLSTIYNPDFIQAIQKLLPPPEVIENLKKVQTTIKAGEILNSLGWWIFPDMTCDDFEKFIKWHEENDDGMIQEVLISYYDNVEGIIEDWENNPVLKKRVHILEDVIWAHNQGKYTLSIPSILPQIEGIIIEGTEEKGYVKQNKIPELAEKLITQGDSHDFRHYFFLTIIESLIKANFEWGNPEENFGRSPVLHGFFTNYDNREYSLKLILLFDYIQKFLSFKRKE